MFRVQPEELGGSSSDDDDDDLQATIDDAQRRKREIDTIQDAAKEKVWRPLQEGESGQRQAS